MNLVFLTVGVIVLYGSIVLYTLFTDDKARKDISDYAKDRYNQFKEDCKTPNDTNL